MLTRSGLGVAAAALTLAACGWWWGYDELLAVAAALAALVVVAVWSARAPVRVDVERTITSLRVTRAEPIRCTYRLSSPTRRRSAPMVLVETLTPTPAPAPPGADTDRSAPAPAVRVELPAVAEGEAERIGLVPATRRGNFNIGPWSIERVDPFGLAVGTRIGGQAVPVIVHPRIHRLRGPHGEMHTVQDDAVIRRTASDPLSGFVSLRDYVDGDDPRLIHWPTSARVGTLMLREHVELRRPEFTVVLDCADSVATPADFEEMVDVTASIAVHAVRCGVNVTLKTTSRQHPGAHRPIDRETRVLDLLTPVGQVRGAGHMSLAEVFHAGVDHTTIVFVTGPTGPSTGFARSDRVSTIRVGMGAAPARGVVLAVDDAVTFAQRWRP